jgi:uncharacterized protein YhhL (DUF1145 family)
MFALMKLGCLVLYAAALAALCGWWQGPAASIVEYAAVIFIAIHVIELPIFFKTLRTYRGSLASSVLQALLFGVLHSLPLKRAQGQS